MARLTATGMLSSKPARPKRAGSRLHSAANPMRCSAAANKFARIGKVESRVGSAISLPALNGISLPVKKSAIGLPTDDPCVFSRAQFVEGGDDVGRSDLGLPEDNPALVHASLDRIIGANRNGGGIRAQVL